MNPMEKGWKILRVLTTNSCNFECVYCHNEGQAEKGKDKISLQHFIRYFNIAKKTGIVEVRFSGGEPLMNAETIQMIEWLDKNSDVEIGLATNGSLVNEDIAKRLGATRTMVTLHFPGVGEEDYCAVTKRHWHLFERCVDLFERYNVDYSFNYTMYPQTISNVDSVLAYSIKNKKRVKLLPFLDPECSNLSDGYIEKIKGRLKSKNSNYSFFEKQGVHIWDYYDGGTVKMIDSPCYKKDICLCKEYGEVRLLPDLSLMNCIFGKCVPTIGKSDEEIFDLFVQLLAEMKACEAVISQ